MADFIAGYISGAASIILGSPLDIIKARLQTSSSSSLQATYRFPTADSLIRGAAPPILTYGGLNAVLFATYNRTFSYLGGSSNPLNVWAAGALGGLTTFVVSTPTELIKCRAQLSEPAASSWSIARSLLAAHGIRGLYIGGAVTSIRDAVGYGFYFAAYQGLKPLFREPEGHAAILVAGGMAGMITWLSVYPLDMVKTRVQTQVLGVVGSEEEERALLGGQAQRREKRMWHGGFGARTCARLAFAEAGCRVFFDGLGICMARAFLVNAVQFVIYEYIMRHLRTPNPVPCQSEDMSLGSGGHVSID